MQLPTDLAKDQELVLRKVLSLLSASVDVLSSEGHLNANSEIQGHTVGLEFLSPRPIPKLIHQMLEINIASQLSST
jgi:pre-mRNA-splicing helicase BRR2